jgi:hypothetical protein
MGKLSHFICPFFFFCADKTAELELMKDHISTEQAIAKPTTTEPPCQDDDVPLVQLETLPVAHLL